MPLVSVVIPTYNSPALLLETLASVFTQTFSDFEIIVINDGSTDNTLEQLAMLQQKYGERLRVVNQPNAGIGVARNRGLDEAMGTYVAFLDHDDLWLPEKLAVQVEFMQRHPECAACGTVFAISDKPQRPHFLLEDVADENGIVNRPFLNIAQGHEVFVTCTLMIDRQRCAGLHYSTVRNAAEDVPFHFKLLTRGNYGIAGKSILAIYRVHQGNASKDPEYYYRGCRLLRQMQREGEFDDLSPVHCRDMKERLSQMGRVSAVIQLTRGRRLKGLQLYVQEFWSQVRFLRLRFLIIFPLMLISPMWIIKIAYPSGQ